MYICNRCGCTAMTEIGRKLVCLNCEHEQSKALSRKRSSCQPNTHGHNAATVQHVAGERPPKPARPAPPAKPVVPLTAPTPQQRAAMSPKKKKAPKAVVLVVAIFLGIFVLNMILGIIAVTFDNINTSYSTSVPEPDYPDDWLTEDHEDDWAVFDDLEGDAYTLYADGPFEIYGDGELYTFNEYDYLEEHPGGSDLVIPETIAGIPVTSIDGVTFWRCEELTSITMPDTVTLLSSYAIEDCTQLREVYLSANLQEIGWQAILDCPNLEAVYYPGTQEMWDQIILDEDNEELLEHLVILE